MFDSFLEAIGRIGIFMICARAIVHFRPKEADEKYMKLLVSIMVLIQLFLPLGGFLLGGGGNETAAALEQFKITLEQGMRQAEENAARSEALLEEMTLEEVRKRVEQQGAKEAEGEAVSETGKEQGIGQIEVKVESVGIIAVGGEEGNHE